MSFAIRALIVAIADGGCALRQLAVLAVLPGISFAGHPIERVIGKTDGVRSCARLVGSRHHLLGQVAIVVVKIRDQSRFGIVGGQKPRKRIVSKAPHPPLAWIAASTLLRD